jgi:hypothetical protein
VSNGLVRNGIDMKTAKGSVLAMIAVLVFVAMMARSTLAMSRPQQTPNPATATTKAEASSSSSHEESYRLEVDGSKQWRDTGIDLRGGEKVRITAEGTITYAK